MHWRRKWQPTPVFFSLKRYKTFWLPLWNLRWWRNWHRLGGLPSLRGSTVAPREAMVWATHYTPAAEVGEVFSPTLHPSLQFSSHWPLPKALDQFQCSSSKSRSDLLITWLSSGSVPITGFLLCAWVKVTVNVCVCLGLNPDLCYLMAPSQRPCGAPGSWSHFAEKATVAQSGCALCPGSRPLMVVEPGLKGKKPPQG